MRVNLNANGNAQCRKGEEKSLHATAETQTLSQDLVITFDLVLLRLPALARLLSPLAVSLRPLRPRSLVLQDRRGGEIALRELLHG